MKIEFTKEEQILFLKKVGYTIDTYKGVRDRDFYSSDKETINVKVDIAYLNQIDDDLDNMNMYWLRDKYSIEIVFNRVISKRFKEFAMKELT